MADDPWMLVWFLGKEALRAAREAGKGGLELV
jgi:hypothetical protein